MKYKVYKLIRDSDFKDADGNYLETCIDVITMAAAIEMARFEMYMTLFLLELGIELSN